MVANRREWRGAYPQPVSIDEINVFGWRCLRHVLEPGAKLVTLALNLIERDKVPNLTFYVRGRASVVDSDGNVLPDRSPGMFSAERPDHPAGTFTVTAIEPLEFYCFNYHANRRALPDLTALRLDSGESVTLPPGSMVLVCSGQLGPLAAGNAQLLGGELTAVGRTYALVFGGARV